MQTNLADFIKGTPDGDEAEAILRACVHCGFCTATCPTYQLLGDELDGPRGRIYLIKQVLEGAPVTVKTQTHLDRCLTCRNCETTCPSGVRYGRLADIGRRVVEERVQRPLGERIKRAVLKEVLPRAWIFRPAFRAGQLFRPLLAPALQDKLPKTRAAGHWPAREHARKMLVLQGCVQSTMAPDINAATARVLDAFGVQLLAAPKAGCCGALRYHLNDQEGGLDDMRRNVDAWWPLVERGQIEAIVMTASGCGVTVKEYGHLLAHDSAYAAKAARIAMLTRDLSEIMPQFEAELGAKLKGKVSKRVAFHPPCTLQHGQQIRGKVEGVLRAAGVDVTLCADSHLCCGSAGTYSVLQPALATELRDRKLASLQATNPEVIVSANIGCQTHLQSGTQTPVAHWIELIDQALA
ncbi:glycolate oxidase subunit GlcF [Massilia sp. P8910]|uniref:glycolate oxidase subunit GlcF n=1 Tax=Massilia antarctica TaxID=2765360 RepID=UPI0006BB85FE|nr:MULTISPECIES: glycolate oxidase subunit GlcF [Massilia]MCE3602578.1 glycolate oxidase subunit GlcF [Massilia antarctica]MCY0912888.1 glycolate oxidase subunit GlcF [Massilia sp. H27-R4]CUI07463.1 Glycolate dehydrogenase, iron-sulfur subunit GlcF [Janthinobacterium sp. CG23_2]CUU31249.1 Glycolate dehydrogenase, iron-sulfur subunit GlcF [Janthinobacterium sp. CG23_2]